MTEHTNREDPREQLRADIVHMFVDGEVPNTPPILEGGYRLSGLSAKDLDRVDGLMALFDQQIAKAREDDTKLLRDMLLHFHAIMNRVQLTDAIKEYKGEGSLNSHLYIAVETAISYFKGRFAIKEEGDSHAD